MEKIGQILKERREEFGFTLAQMSDKTKVPLPKLRAIEEGNIQYFKDEMTYVKFYVKYYCNALHINYDEFREDLSSSLDTFNETSQFNRTQELKTIHERVKGKVEVKDDQSKPRKKRKKIKFDFLLLSLFVFIGVIVSGLLFVFSTEVYPLLVNQTNDTNNFVNVPDPIDQEKPVVDPEPEPEEIVFNINQVDSTHYEISGYEIGETIQFKLLIKSDSYISVRINGKITSNPQRKIYTKGTIMQLSVQASDDLEIQIYVGYVYLNQLFIQDKRVEFNPELAQKNVSSTFIFIFKGATQ
jgi:transcriptional regulator with XRE-family HTH domain